MCIHIQSVTYMHPDKDVLFSNVSFSMGKGEKVALIGNNGSGKSTLMQLITKELSPSEGEVIVWNHLIIFPNTSDNLII